MLPDDPADSPESPTRGDQAKTRRTQNPAESPPETGGSPATIITLGAVARPPATHPDAVPRRFGNYELLERLGKGGMGIVWKAKLVGTERLVALKQVVADEFASAAAIERFKVEARAAAALDHPGIVPVY